jgi:hypothetical protein
MRPVKKIAAKGGHEKVAPSFEFETKKLGLGRWVLYK